MRPSPSFTNFQSIVFSYRDENALDDDSRLAGGPGDLAALLRFALKTLRTLPPLIASLFFSFPYDITFVDHSKL